MARSLLILGLTFFAISCVSPVVNEGTSMSPNLNHGDRFLITDNIGTIERGEILVFTAPNDAEKSYVKRVIGLPGESISIEKGVVLIDGKPLMENYLSKNELGEASSMAAKTIGENRYFVMGDNRAYSTDSRVWGPISRKLIKGKLYYRYYKARN